MQSLKYAVLFDALDGTRDTKSAESRKRPESSSPEKLKARNKEKYSSEKPAEEPLPAKVEEEDEDYKEEQFEQMLDKDDSEPNDQAADKKEDYIDEDKMLDIAEKCFMRIAEAILAKDQTVRDAFRKHITKEASETGEEVELLSPLGFLECVKSLGITDL